MFAKYENGEIVAINPFNADEGHGVTTEVSKNHPDVLAFYERKGLPASVKIATPLQMRRALRAAGILSAVQALVDNADEETREAWQYAIEIRSDSALLLGLAAQMTPPLTSQQIDELFDAANLLPAV